MILYFEFLTICNKLIKSFAGTKGDREQFGKLWKVSTKSKRPFRTSVAMLSILINSIETFLRTLRLSRSTKQSTWTITKQATGLNVYINFSIYCTLLRKCKTIYKQKSNFNRKKSLTLFAWENDTFLGTWNSGKSCLVSRK